MRRRSPERPAWYLPCGAVCFSPFSITRSVCARGVRGRMAMARWLVDPAGAAQSGRDADVSLSRVLARIDASLAAPDRLTDA